MRFISKNKEISRISKFFTSLIVLYPILIIYRINIASFRLSLADVILLSVLPYMAMKMILKRKINLNFSFLLVFIYCGIHYITNVHTAEISDTMHFLIVLFILCFFVNVYFDKEYAIQIFIKVGIVSSIYLLFQFIMLKLLGLYIPGTIPFIPAVTSTSGAIRPFSFFSEPSAFGLYNSFVLVTILFNKNFTNKKRFKFAIIISISLLASVSTTSICLMLIAWLLWLISRQEELNRKAKIVLIFGFMLVLIIPFAELKYGIVSEIYNHSFVGLASGKENMAKGLQHRIGDTALALDYYSDKGWNSRLFGQGIVEINEVLDSDFIPTVGRINIFYGIVGYFIFGFLFFNTFIKSGKYGRAILIIAFVVSFFAEILFGQMMLWYMPYILGWSKKDYNYSIRNIERL